MSLKHAILGFLSYAPMSGYDLKKAFDGSVRHFWPADQSQIYRTLRELQAAGAIARADEPAGDQPLDRKVYTITAAGRDDLLQWLAAPLPIPSERLPQLVQLYFAALLDDRQVLALLSDMLAQVDAALAIFAAINARARQSLVGVDPRWAYYSMLTLDYGVAQARAMRAWLERTVAQIQSGDLSPAAFAQLFPEADQEGV